MKFHDILKKWGYAYTMIMFEKGTVKDIDGLESLYNAVNDYLANGINYSGWEKGFYPVRATAALGIEEGGLYTVKEEGKIVGSIILRHKPEEAYMGVKWKIEADDKNISVLHTFAVHPDYHGKGIGSALIEFAVKKSRELQMKAVRLDVYEKNIPAIRLYEKCGFSYVDTVDMGLRQYGLNWFHLYEKVCEP